MLFLTQTHSSHLLLDRPLGSKLLALLKHVKQVWRHDDIAVDVSVVVCVHELASAIEHVRRQRHVKGVHAVVALAVDAEGCTETDDGGTVGEHDRTKRVGALEQLEHVERVLDPLR